MSEKEQASIPATESVEEQVSESSTESSTEQVTEKKTESDDTIKLSKSELDRRINEAVFKAKEKEKKKLEQEMLTKNGEWESAYNKTKEELESLQKEIQKAEFERNVTRLANEAGVGDYTDILTALPDQESVQKAIDRLSSSVKKTVEQVVNERLHNKAPIPGSNGPSKSPKDMSPDEYAKWREQQIAQSTI
jgi:hypothetical protein